MAAGEAWEWSWRTEQTLLGGSFPVGLNDAGGPSFEEEVWVSTRLSIYRMASEIYHLILSRKGDSVTVTGQVTKNATKSRIEELIAAHRLTVNNQVVVAAPFKPASGADLEISLHSRQKPATASITRFPEIQPTGDAVPGSKFTFLVDLAAADDGKGNGITIDHLPSDWSSLEIEAEVVSNALHFSGGESLGTILINADGNSTPAEFTAILNPLPGAQSFEIKVLFSYNRRHSGVCRRTIEIPDAAAPKPDVSSGPTEPSLPSVVFVPRAQAPTLMIRISDIGGGDFQWLSLAPQGVGSGPREARISLGDARSFAHQLLGKCPVMPPGRHRSPLQGVGEQIWQKAPERFRNLMAAMRKEFGPEFPIQLITDEPYIPWEMMFPTADSGIEQPTHLYLTHPIARWFVASESNDRHQLPRGRVASFVPEYEDQSALQSTLEEARWFETNLRATRCEATYDSFTNHWGEGMPESRTSIVHFAGHGRSQGPDQSSGIKMTNEEWVTSDDIHGGVKLGERDGSFVILNACAAGAADAALGVIEGFPSRLASRGFRAILAPIWAVLDSQASQVVCDQAQRLVGGKTLGESMRDARALHQNASSTPFAYICYGDVMAKMSGSTSVMSR